MLAVAEEPHVAFLQSPGLGHIIPLFQFAKHLVLHHQVRVSFLVITTGASNAQNQFLQSATIPPQLQVVNIPQSDMTDIITEDMLLLTKLCVMTQESLKPLKSILVELKPKALIIDIFTTQAIDVCEELSIPVYSFFTASNYFTYIFIVSPQTGLPSRGRIRGPSRAS
ncbi:anthocyanidin 3-O-glucosyltransferase 5-like [Olea europaea subsp. europaea]|uniref:Anthocyanidin 3-O-glucosyltransferase 5-like n=1 Tax=Olea europaea subsp. europaea TaxID=158383 RepID=A0A8S0T0F3_OLEEU|nr:anthocyanidin 3-O-glucosyltransferase 5-like [Olea europaea subsp. europaea]